MSTRTYLPFCFLIAALLACLGCSSELKPVPVSMTVQYKGKPVTDIRVNLLNDTGGSAFAFTDTSGKTAGFKTAGKDGVIPGAYKVTLAPKEGDEPAPGEALDYSTEPTKQPFPPKYRSADKSDQSVTVKSDGENSFTVELTD